MMSSNARRFTTFRSSCASAPDALERLTRTAARSLGGSVAILHFADRDCQAVHASVDAEVEDAWTRGAFLARTLSATEPLVVADPAAHPRFADDPLVAGPPHARFYAGAPLPPLPSTPDAPPPGVLAVFGPSPRSLSPADHAEIAAQIADFAALAMDLAGPPPDASRTERRTLQDEAQKEVDSLQRLKSSILVNVNHEIRTPVTAIRLLADTLADALSDNDRRLCEKILTQTERLDGILSSILQLAQIDTGAVDLTPTRTDLVDLLHPLLAAARADTAPGVRFDAALPDATVPAMVDARVLRKAIRKCLDNAVKFTASGTVRVELAASPTTATIVIEDTGVGIEADHLPYVFEPFYQESDGNSRAFEGAGLGLTIAQGLLRCLGGTIALNSTKAQGTQLTLSLPRRLAASAESASA